MSASESLDVVLASGRLRIQRWGATEAPLAIAVPGLSGTSANLAYLAERIAGADLQVVAIDPRGRGRSETTAAGTYGWENHARDVFALADVLGAERFAVVGQSMGASVAMKAAELDGDRLGAVILIDVAGRVDPGVGPVIGAALERLGRVYGSADEYVAEVRAAGLHDPWSDDWERSLRAELGETEGGVRSRADPDALAEDRAYTATQHPTARWAHLTMATLLVRATRELRPGAGHTVPAGERDAFRRAVPYAEIVEIDGNHLTVNTHPDLPDAVRRFLLGSMPW
jgi:pimeloyl-ACP methyl ester carboxylesterase